jgi:hypothetical protein
MDKDFQITGTICCPISICALGTRTHQMFITTESNLLPLEGRAETIV